MCNKNIFKNYIHKRSERDGFGAGGELMGTVRRRHPSEMLIRKSWNEVGRGLHQTVSGGGDVLPGWSRTLKVCQADLPPEPEETEEPWAEEAGPMECGPSSGDAKDLGASVATRAFVPLRPLLSLVHLKVLGARPSERFLVPEPNPL